MMLKNTKIRIKKRGKSRISHSNGSYSAMVMTLYYDNVSRLFAGHNFVKSPRTCTTEFYKLFSSFVILN